MRELMNTKPLTVIALLAPLIAMSALAQQPNAPKASKADVQKVITSINGDKAKLANYCAFSKLDDQVEAIATKDSKDPKLQSLSNQLSESIRKVGPDFEKIMNSELDEASGAL